MKSVGFWSFPGPYFSEFGLEIHRIRTIFTQCLATETFKTINKLNPDFIKNMFTPKSNAKVRKNDILIKKHNSVTYGDKIVLNLVPKIWNELQQDIKQRHHSDKLRNTSNYPYDQNANITSASSSEDIRKI